MTRLQQNVPGEVKSKEKFNADAMTLNDSVQRNSQMMQSFVFQVVYFKMPEKKTNQALCPRVERAGVG